MKLDIPQWRSLTTRVTLFTLAIFVIGVWSLAFYAHRMLREDMQRLLGEQQLSTVSFIAADVNQELELRLRALEKVAGKISPAILGNAAALQAFLEQRLILQGVFNGGTFATRLDGTVTASLPLSERTGASYPDSDLVAAALKEGRSTIGRPVMGKTLRAPVIDMTVPIRDAQGNVIGALVGATNLGMPNFLDDIAKGRYGKTGGYVLIAPQHRLIVTATDKSRIMEALPAPGVIPMMDHYGQGYEGTAVFVNPRGVEVLASVKGVPVAGWYVSVQLPTLEAFAPIRVLQQRMLLATIFLTLLAGGLTWWMLRRQLSPLLATAKTLATLSDTNQPPQPLPITSQDEIGQLIGGFNRLLETLGRREITLRESESSLREAQEVACVGSYVFDVPDDAWRSSATLDTIFGIGADFPRTVAGWVQTVHPTEREQMVSYLRDTIAAHRRFDREYRIVRVNDGAERWVLGLGKVEYGADGAALRMVGTIQDVTERKLAEDQLRQREESLAITLQSIGDAVIATDAAGLITRMNTTAERLTGWPLADAIGRPLPEVFCLIEAQTRAPSINPVQLLTERGEVVGACDHTALIARDGREYQIANSTAPIRNPAGQIVGVVLVFSDVTEADRVRKSLVTTADLLERTGEMAKVGGWELDLRTMEHFWSRETCRILDVDPPAAPAFEQGINFYLRETRPTIQAAVEAAINSGTPYDLELPLVTAKGRPIWVRAQGSAVMEDGKAIKLHGAFQDITARKQAEETLRESEARFRELFDDAPVGYHELNAGGRIVRVNRTELQLLGYTEEEMLGRAVAEFVVDSALSAEIDRATLAGHLPVGQSFEREYRRKDGSKLVVALSDKLIRDSHGQIVGIRTSVQDNTDRKRAEEALHESEERYQRITAAVTDYIYTVRVEDGRAAETTHGPGCVAVTGYRPSEFANDPFLWFHMVADEDRSEVEKQARRILADEDPTPIEHRIVHKNGTVRWVRNTFVPHREEDGALVAYDGLIQDITERKRVEEALRHAQKLESIGTLAGGIAHDFNNLLNAVLGQSALALAKLSKKSAAGNHVAKAINAAERAADLTRELLAYSGRGKFVTKEIDLNRFVEDNTLLLELSVPKTTRLRLALDSSVLWVHGDVAQLQQVIMNLIINAGEAMAANPGSIGVGTRRIELTEDDTEYWKYTNTPLAPGPYALLEVSDSGSGIRPEQLNRIFDPFFTTKFTGRGLGLAAVLGIVRGHAGGIRITSEEGNGTRFDVVLPIVEAPARTDGHSSDKAPAVGGQGKTVLVIDDEPSVLELVTDIFTEAQFSVIGALDSLEGISLYRQHQENISVVILDYSMPGMDGKAAFAELVKINHDVKVLLCSGYSEEEMESAFGDVRPAGFIHKPYRPTVLVERTSQLLSE